MFEELEGFISHQWRAVLTLFSMVKLEAKLAKLSIYPLFMNVLMLGVVLMSLWLTTISLLGYGIFWFTDNVFMSLGGILLSQAILLGLLIKYLRFNLKSISFERTRRYLNATPSTARGASHHELKKTGDSSTRATGTPTTNTANKSA